MKTLSKPLYGIKPYRRVTNSTHFVFLPHLPRHPLFSPHRVGTSVRRPFGRRPRGWAGVEDETLFAPATHVC